MEIKDATPGTKFKRNMTSDESKDYKMIGYGGTVKKNDGIQWVTDQDGHPHLIKQLDLVEKAEEEEILLEKYDPKFGNDKMCECGHTYYRHFDNFEDMKPVGCKYCGCRAFKEVKTEVETETNG